MSRIVNDRRVAAGEWYAVFGETATVVLPPSARSRVAALWELADAGAAGEELLDAVLAGGLSSLSDLLMVAEAGDALRVLTRGQVVATVATPDGEVTVEPDPGLVWGEQIFTAAVGVLSLIHI